MTKDMLNAQRPEQQGSRVMNQIYENEEFFTTKDEDKVVNLQKRFRSLESTGGSQKK